MASAHEKLTERFYAWEGRGRGWHVFPEPVSIEPPFRPFYDEPPPATGTLDDGVRPTVLNSLMQKLSRALASEPPQTPPVVEEQEDPEPEQLIREDLIELETSLPADFDVTREAFEQFLLNCSRCLEPIAFEVLGVSGRIGVQFAAHSADALRIQSQLKAHFPEGLFQSKSGTLEQAWLDSTVDEVLVFEFGLAREFMFSLATGKLDPFVGIIGALSELQPGELGLFQVLFQPVRHPWAKCIVQSVSHADGRPFFVNAPELNAAAKAKAGCPLYAAVVRIAVASKDEARTLKLACDLAGSLCVFGNPQGNELIPLNNDDYPFEDHVEDVLRRQSRRSGMLLTADELIGFVHLPGSSVRSPLLVRDAGKTKAAPKTVRGTAGILLGHNSHAGESLPIRLTPEQRVQHMHVVGIQGTGKSTFLFNLIRQDIESGVGLAVLDPHGDLINQILGIIPESRIADVVLVDPSDEEYSVGFNILSAHSDAEKRLLASDLVSVFQRLSTSWGDQMGSVLQNAILAFLESSRGGTLADLRRFLLEPPYRAEFLETVRDPNIVYYWRKGFSQLAGNKSIGSVITRLNDFLAPKPIRYMVSQQSNRLDFGAILDTGKIFLAKLPHGLIGKENSFLLGSLLVAKFQQMAMARQAQKISVRKDFFLYIDEFHNFITPSMTEILTGARKYRLGLILAHQELRQLERDREVSSAVLSMPFSRVVFRVGDSDARALENGFSFFEARALQNLPKGQAICRVETADSDFNLSVPFPEPVSAEISEATRHAVIAASRAAYATSRAQIESAEAVMFKQSMAEVDIPAMKPVARTPQKDVQSKAADRPTQTVSEKGDAVPFPPVESRTVPTANPPPPLVEAPRVSRESKPIPDLGRGGPEHKKLQKDLQAEAHALGFAADIESPLPGKDKRSAQAVDLALRRGDIAIAVEIPMTTTTAHEVGNVEKCLTAGFIHVAVVSDDQERLKEIRQAVDAKLGSEAGDRVDYQTPGQFVAYLKTLPMPIPAQSEVRRRGYKVTRTFTSVTTDDQKRKEDVAIPIIANVMRRKKNK